VWLQPVENRLLCAFRRAEPPMDALQNLGAAPFGCWRTIASACGPANELQDD
jgi:hypothetical protein